MRERASEDPRGWSVVRGRRLDTGTEEGRRALREPRPHVVPLSRTDGGLATSLEWSHSGRDWSSDWISGRFDEWRVLRL